MSDNRITPAMIVLGQTVIDPSQRPLQLALFNADGSPYSVPVAATTAVAGTVKKMPAQVDSVAADLTAMKVDFNALLAKMRTAGLLS